MIWGIESLWLFWLYSSRVEEVEDCINADSYRRDHRRNGSSLELINFPSV